MNEATAPAYTQATLTPTEIGAQMAALREQFKLSQQEVSERLHIRPRYVSAIEEGRYDLMPGKVYARGYVHTYAEFLGLNAEQIVAQCFVGELPANAQPIPPIAAARYTTPTARTSISSSRSGRWRGYTVLAAIALAAVLVVGQFRGHDSDTPKPEETTVAPVPEAMLASVRTMVMPLPENYNCLMDDALLACFNAGDTAYLLSHLDAGNMMYGGVIDVSRVTIEPAIKETPVAVDAAAKVDEAPTVENPDSPAVATTPVAADANEEGPNRTPPHDD